MNNAVLNLAAARLIDALECVANSIALSNAFSIGMPEHYTTIKKMIEMVERCRCNDDISATTLAIGKFSNDAKLTIELACAKIIDIADDATKQMLMSMHHRSQTCALAEVADLNACLRTFILAIDGNNCIDKFLAVIIDVINDSLDYLNNWVTDSTRYQGNYIAYLVTKIKFAVASRSTEKITPLIDELDRCFNEEPAFTLHTGPIDRITGAIKKHVGYFIEMIDSVEAKLTASEKRIAELEAKLAAAEMKINLVAKVCAI